MADIPFKGTVLYNLLFSKANDAIILVDDQDRILDANPNACRLYGYTRKELLMMSVPDVQAPECRAQPGTAVTGELIMHGTSKFETVDIRKNGKRIFVEITNTSTEVEGKKYFFSIVRDITERKRIETELRVSEKLKKAIIESPPYINIWAVDLDYRYTFFNNAHKRGMKDFWNADIKIGDSILDYVTDPQYRNEIKKYYDIILSEGRVHNNIDHLRTTKGEDKYFENIGSPIIESGGKITGATIFTTEITDRVLLEHKLKKSLALQESIMNSPPDILILSIDKEYRYVFFNNAHRERMMDIWGTQPRIGENIFDFIPDREYREDVRKHYDRALAGENFLNIDEFNDRKGEKKYFENISAPVTDAQGNIIGLTVFILDVTDRMISEQRVKESLHEKEVLLKEIHHRVKNNMQVISSMLNLQMDTIRNNRMKLVLKESQNRINTMALIHEQLYQSKNLSEIDMRGYTRPLVHFIADSYFQKDRPVEIRYELEEIYLDIDKAIPIGLIINELVSNSLKYAFQGRSQGNISIMFRSEPDNRLHLQISDDGVGFTGDVQAEKQSTLGLQMVYALASQIDGIFALENGPDGVTADLLFHPSVIGDNGSAAQEQL